MKILIHKASTLNSTTPKLLARTAAGSTNASYRGLCVTGSHNPR